MDLVSLKIKNFMSIRDAELKLGQINQVVGKNSQGKTTILKALETAIKGSSDGSLVTFGEERAEIIVELSDQTIRRTLSSAGKGVASIRKGEFSVQSPQTYLEQMFDFSAFNPLELLEPKKRSEAIMKSIEIKVTPEMLAEKLGVAVEALPPVDFNQHGLKVIEDLHKYYFNRRAEANKATVEKKNRWETYKKDLKDTDVEPKFTRLQITAKRTALDKKQTKLDTEHGAAKQQVETDKTERANLYNYNKELEQIDRDIVEIEKTLQTAKARRQKGQEIVDELTKKLEKNPAPDLSGFNTAAEAIKTERQALISAEREIEAYEAVSKNREMVGTLETEFKTAQEFSDKLDKVVGMLHSDLKKELMSKSEMPIKGLEYKDGSFLIDGTPVDNLSTSLAMKLAVSVARKLCKKTKFICLDGAERLDKESYEQLIKDIKGDGFTYFITRVDGDESIDGVNTIQMAKGVVQ